MNIFSFFHIANDPKLLLAIVIVALISKIFLIKTLILKGINSQTTLRKPWGLLIGILGGASIIDLAWIIKCFDIVGILDMSYNFTIFCIRLAYACLTLQYVSLALFLKFLTNNRKQYSLREKIVVGSCSLFSVYFIAIALLEKNPITPALRMSELATIISSNPEIIAMRLIILSLLVLISLAISLLYKGKKKANAIPKILYKQIQILTIFFILPFLLVEFIGGIFTTFLLAPQEVYFLVISISTLLLTCAIAYCMKKIMALRFLNFGSHVESKKKFNFINDFADLLEQLSKSQTTEEISHVVKQFCKDALTIPLNKISFHIRSFDNISSNSSPHDLAIQHFLNNHSSNICTFMSENKILVYDEILFSNYYEEDATQQQIITFLDSINADIFLPIYQDDKKVACVVIERDALEDRLYSKVNQDELVIFATYVGNIFNLLQSKNLELSVNQKKALQEELYQKHQEILHYKESLDSFIRNKKQSDIGIIFYKNRSFSFANQAAQDIVGINLNMQEGHPLSKAIKKVARQVEKYKTPQRAFAQDQTGNSLVITGVLHMEHKSIIIMIHYPGVADIVTKQLHFLRDPSQWDYLLYLETTQIGKLIDQALPGEGETLLNVKIELLKAALSKKALLLDLASDDLLPTVELLHHISLRESLHTISLAYPLKDQSIAKALFGINPLLSDDKPEKPLLEKLDNIGTLFIKNIQYIDLNTQEALATYIKYGYFSPLYSEHRIYTNVRIVCSSNVPLKNLVSDGAFSVHLLDELNKLSLRMPSLVALPETELLSLADGFGQQSLQTDNFANILALTDKEKHKIINTKPASIRQFKTKVQQMLSKKVKKSTIQETEFNPAYTISDPSLAEASRLGKHALRDRTIMALLWNKFNKNQHQIALFLGVNRSSVSRRCKKYGLYNHELGENHA